MYLYTLCMLAVMSRRYYSEIRDEIKFLCMHVCYLRQGACVHFVICDSSAYHMTDKMTFLLNI